MGKYLSPIMLATINCYVYPIDYVNSGCRTSNLKLKLASICNYLLLG